MKAQQFLEHYGIDKNPFAEEDAQTDPVFKQHCIASTYHPTWDKIYGNPAEPATAIVFGEKGAGKTAMRLQIVRHLAEFNRRHPDQRVFIIEYDDFNMFLDRFRDALPARKRKGDRLLNEWKLWDHMDSILALGVTDLVDRILETKRRPRDSDDETWLDLRALDRLQARDLLLLAACYDQSLGEPFAQRWNRLRRKLHFHTWRSRWPLALGAIVTVAALGLFTYAQGWHAFANYWMYLVILAGWIPWLWKAWNVFLKARGIARQIRTVHHDRPGLQRVLMQFRREEIAGQPLPTQDRTDDRYECLTKFQGILRTLGYAGIVVLVDRVDEPHLINGSAEKMRALLWPLLDNKLLKHPGIGFKLLLPVELSYYIEKEGRDFNQRARLDKQNLVRSLDWTGEALYDVANARLAACSSNAKPPTLVDLFDENVTKARLLDALRDLRVPRHMFKFLYRLIAAHNNAYTDDNPRWKISSEMFESQLALYKREQDAFDRGTGTV